MSATVSGALSGVVFGISLVFLGQQLGYVDLGALGPGLESLIGGTVIFAVLFGVGGRALGRRYVRRHTPSGSPAAESGATAGTPTSDAPAK
ncbi:MAG TPA: hypothetical protein VJQ43_00630 [Thermoplasmata archaeon]|nr:hypothetical protein [Thermoplasmata archaeon]